LDADDLDMFTAEKVSSMGLTDGIVFNLTTDLLSGSIMTQNLSLKIQDELGNIIVTDSSSQVTLTPIQTHANQKV